MRHGQLNVMQQDEVGEVDLEPIRPRITRLQLLLQHLKNLLQFWLKNLVDDDKIDLEIYDGRNWDSVVVGAIRVWVC